MRYLAFYLPQFHPIPENDRWWGRGFTEWRNVTRATPRFRGHDQPKLPADLGFYDLRCDATREDQAELARQYGIDGFVYYHYWFSGRRLLSEPADRLLQTGRPDFPFCFCWANESWTRAWDGKDREVLIAQRHSLEDDAVHIEWLLEAFTDERYIRIGNRPLFLIYRADLLPDVPATLALWKARTRERLGEPAYLMAVRSNFDQAQDSLLLEWGFDGVCDFQPNARNFPPLSPRQRLMRRFKPLYQLLQRHGNLHAGHARRISYRGVMRSAIGDLQQAPQRFPCVFPNWDNSARRAISTVIQNEDFDLFADWMRQARKVVERRPQEEQILFVNAWNEWAEGCYLEPDLKHGTSMLEAVRASRGAGFEATCDTPRLFSRGATR